jgi:hypothetical protein
LLTAVWASAAQVHHDLTLDPVTRQLQAQDTVTAAGGLLSMRGGILAVTLLAAGLAQAAQEQRTDPDTGTETWETRAHGVTLRLTQILPDQARAFYINRGFSAEDVEPYAKACVFMTVLRNDAAPGAVEFKLANWRVRVNGILQSPRPVEDWDALWRQRGLAEPARIAFRWAQFPPEQEYEVGEWNQGMLATGLPAGSRFDLVARWRVEGKNYEGVLTDVRCPP